MSIKRSRAIYPKSSADLAFPHIDYVATASVVPGLPAVRFGEAKVSTKAVTLNPLLLRLLIMC